MKQTFPKKEHLKRKKLLDELFSTGKKVSAYPLLLFYVETPLPEENIAIQAGVSVAKRNHKLAVTRNRIKRLMREVYRKNKTQFQTNDKTFAFMFIYTGREVMAIEELDKAMLKLAEKFNKLHLPENL
ncbi:ribonuclease P protein component [Leeuwenhoekiella polynyae]|uniref:Ribonuclease P protein component n=1 Tax=Leeuwenhoekiella polynyae TaxID=1550906 RepID=A0A4Q0PHM5_9FLAO|nr:ribonuclease P protein component [Leeuwenhoekiella polynyae]RXG26445.1 ribonuclease P protein component [Leeuwenhoekiella polynyae]|tara:strand:- start:1116 stop:1499 length:384 start_codon:yes stop_codon:yes gene_type:complete